MEKRTIEVSKQTAKDWYRSGNATLKALALDTFRKEELEPESYEEIRRELSIEGVTMIAPSTRVPIACIPEERLHSKLVTIARYFNGENWLKKPDETGYFISISRISSNPMGAAYSASISTHLSVTYPGVVYFKRKQDAQAAMKMVAKELTMYME